MTDDAVLAALRLFKRTQNIDGSWGVGEEAYLATPLVLFSFLGRGETSHSREFSNSVIQARAWLLKAEPKSVPARLATIIVLADYCSIEYASNRPEQWTNETIKIQALTAGLSPTNGGMWSDFAAFYSPHANPQKPAWMRYGSQLEQRYLGVAPCPAPKMVPEYLQCLLGALANFRKDQNAWFEFQRKSTAQLMQWQQTDGSFPAAEGQSRYAATALAALRLEIYYQYGPQY